MITIKIEVVHPHGEITIEEIDPLGSAVSSADATLRALDAAVKRAHIRATAAIKGE